jgi:hypothetical protein
MMVAEVRLPKIPIERSGFFCFSPLFQRFAHTGHLLSLVFTKRILKFSLPIWEDL